MKVTDLTSLYQHQLKDLMSVEKQLAQALTKLADAASNEQLKQLFQEHREETVAQGERITELLQAQSVSGTRHKCKGIAGIIEEGEEIVALDAGEDKADVKDVGLIGAARRAEHYEIAAYGTAAALAKQLGLAEDVKVLKEILEQEKVADKKLTALATGEVNEEAEDAEATSSESSETKNGKGQKVIRRDEYGYNQGGGRDQEFGQYSQRGGRSGGYDREETERDESGRFSSSGSGSGRGQYGQFGGSHSTQGQHGGRGQQYGSGQSQYGNQQYGSQGSDQQYGRGQGYDGQGGGRGEHGGGNYSDDSSSGRYGASGRGGYDRGNDEYGSSRSGSDSEQHGSSRGSNRSQDENRGSSRSRNDQSQTRGR